MHIIEHELDDEVLDENPRIKKLIDKLTAEENSLTPVADRLNWTSERLHGQQD